MKIARTFALATTIAVMLAGCGGKTSGGGNASVASSGDGSGGSETAAVDCPAQIATPGRPASAPTDDVIGIRFGQTYEEAANLVKCEDKTLALEPATHGFEVKDYGQKLRQGFDAGPPKPSLAGLTGKQIVQQMQDDAYRRGAGENVDQLKPGQERFSISTVGVPGQERVAGIWREQWFEAGRNPAITDLAADLAKKYGPPTLTDNQSSYWLYDAMGRPMTQDSPLVSACRGGANPGFGNFSLNPDCGLTIATWIAPAGDNPDLARSLNIAVTDQAKGYAAIDATEQALSHMDADRRAGEVQRARQNADAPKL